MDKNSNTYTLIYSSVMVIIVAAALALTNGVLKEKQAKNGDVDKMSQILRSVKIDASLDQAESLYNKTIVNAYVIDSSGKVTISDPRKAFEIDVSKEVRKEQSSRQLPVYEANIDGSKKYIIPVYGAGLWGPIWGYLSLNDDRKTIFAASYSHQGETPGLGAEINTLKFQQQFEGKKILIDGVFKSVAVLKSGQKVDDRDAVDGISGGTITSKGLEAMLLNSLGAYQTFFNMADKK
jgi:Na+-transporting NADH:ubiquinone oxidoreductase subunit C